MTRIARHVFVSGRVQGVGFRWYTQERAEAHGVSGWVRNRYDGRVEAWVEGEEEAVEALLADLRRGPRPARVDGVDAREVAPEHAPDFRTRGTT